LNELFRVTIQNECLKHYPDKGILEPSTEHDPMRHRYKAGKYDSRVEGEPPEVPVVGEKVWMSLGKETDEDQDAHEDHVDGLPELGRRERTGQNN